MNYFSIFLWNLSAIDQFFTVYNIDSSFSRLRLFVLHGIKLTKLLSIRVDLVSLADLLSLIIHLDDDCQDLSDVYRLICRFPSLNSNQVLLKPSRRFISLPMSNNDQFSKIKYLVMNHHCNLDGLIDILSHTPHISKLTCQYLYQSNRNISNEVMRTLINLTYASIDDCRLLWDIFQMFIIKIASHMQVLHIGVKSLNRTYLN